MMMMKLKTMMMVMVLAEELELALMCHDEENGFLQKNIKKPPANVV